MKTISLALLAARVDARNGLRVRKHAVRPDIAVRNWATPQAVDFDRSDIDGQRKFLDLDHLSRVRFRRRMGFVDYRGASPG